MKTVHGHVFAAFRFSNLSLR